MNRDNFQISLRETLHNRGKDYGDAADNFRRIISLWETVLGIKITEAQFAQMMILMKIARLNETPDHTDSWVDIAGYAALACEITGDEDYDL